MRGAAVAARAGQARNGGDPMWVHKNLKLTFKISRDSEQRLTVTDKNTEQKLKIVSIWFAFANQKLRPLLPNIRVNHITPELTM